MTMSMGLALGPAPRGELAHADFIHDLFVRYSDVLRSYIRRRVENEADVAELVQEVYARLMLRKEAERLHAAPESYLFRTAINLIRDRHRRNTARCAGRHIPFEDGLANSGQEDPEAHLAARQLGAILEEAIEELNPRKREVFLLRLICELSYREIETRTRIPLRSVERYMSQAMDYCCARVAKQL